MKDYSEMKATELIDALDNCVEGDNSIPYEHLSEKAIYLEWKSLYDEIDDLKKQIKILNSHTHDRFGRTVQPID